MTLVFVSGKRISLARVHKIFLIPPSCQIGNCLVLDMLFIRFKVANFCIHSKKKGVGNSFACWQGQEQMQEQEQEQDQGQEQEVRVRAFMGTCW